MLMYNIDTTAFCGWQVQIQWIIYNNHAPRNGKTLYINMTHTYVTKCIIYIYIYTLCSLWNSVGIGEWRVQLTNGFALWLNVAETESSKLMLQSCKTQNWFLACFNCGPRKITHQCRNKRVCHVLFETCGNQDKRIALSTHTEKMRYNSNDDN